MGSGREDPQQYVWSGAPSLGQLRRRAGAPIAIAFEDDALDRIAQAIERELVVHHDLVAQWLTTVQAAQRELGRTVHIDPNPIGKLPLPSYEALETTWNLLLPDDRAAGLFVFDRGQLWNSLILEKRGGQAVRVTSSHALGLVRPVMERRGEILAAMERRVARPHIALFATLGAWRAIVGPEVGALAREVALRQAILDPAPPWALALAGAGAVAGVAKEASRLLGRFVPSSVKATARAFSPFAALGFDPIDLFVKIRKSF